MSLIGYSLGKAYSVLWSAAKVQNGIILTSGVKFSTLNLGLPVSWSSTVKIIKRFWSEVNLKQLVVTWYSLGSKIWTGSQHRKPSIIPRVANDPMPVWTWLSLQGWLCRLADSVLIKPTLFVFSNAPLVETCCVVSVEVQIRVMLPMT